MKVLLIILSLFWCSVGWASAKKVEIEFEFFNTGISSANLYMDGEIVCTEEPVLSTTKSASYTFICDSVLIDAGEHTFYMTAMLFGNETGPSNIFPFAIELMIIEGFILVVE